MPPPPPPPREMDWSALPLELLQEIVKKLASVVEFVRFRAVCRSWRSAASPADLPPQQPWLMLPYNPDTDARSFFCLSTGIIRVLRLPETRNKRICGSGHGWFILFEYETTVVTLFNPLTGSLISLPPLGVPARMWYSSTSYQSNVSASLSANPTSSSGCIVAVFFTCTPTMAFCRLRPGGSGRWSKLQMKLRTWVTSIAYHHGKLCTIDDRDSLMIWDTTPQRLLTVADLCVKLPSLGEGWNLLHRQFVDSPEDLLLVAYGCEGNPDPASRRDCSVIYRFDSESQQLIRVVSESIGDGVWLLYGNSMVPVSAGVYVSCRKCLYFARCWANDGEQRVTVMVKKLDLEKDGSEELQFESGYGQGFVSEAAWLVPSLIN